MLQVAILVDDNGTGVFRYAVGKFIETMLGRAEFAIATVTPQTLKLVDYTANAQTLSEGIARMRGRHRTTAASSSTASRKPRRS